jgi:septal ring factor EnvC (AmiA/AmiB activator)
LAWGGTSGTLFNCSQNESKEQLEDMEGEEIEEPLKDMEEHNGEIEEQLDDIKERLKDMDEQHDEIRKQLNECTDFLRRLQKSRATLWRLQSDISDDE